MNVMIDEQETHISWNRGDEYATVYTSDRTTMTKLDRKCEDNPDAWQIIDKQTISGDVVAKTYKCPRKLISFRNMLSTRKSGGNPEALKKYREQKQKEKMNET